MNEMSMFGLLANALDQRKGADGDTNAGFPRSDAEDMSRGARFIPSEVTDARRRGEKVEFVTKCGPCCWYWRMPDATRIYHCDSLEYERIARRNGRSKEECELGGAGPCPDCGNSHTNGATVAP